MKLLLVSHVSELYGAARSLLTLARGLQARGHMPYVIVPRRGTLESALSESGIGTIEIEAPPWALPRNMSVKVQQWYLRRVIWTSRQIADVIRQFKPDLVHTNSAIIPSGALAARWTGVPHVWHLREQVVEHYDQQFILGHRVTLWLMGTLSAALIAVSHSTVAAYTAPATTGKLHVVYNGLELPPGVATMMTAVQCQSNAKNAEPMLVLVGVLHPGKGQDEAIRALAILRSKGVSCRLTLLGADPVGYGPTLHVLAQELGVAPYVTFTGHLADPLPTMAGSAVVLMCSRSEAFGRVTVEAMLLGRPVVAADTGGSPEIVKDGCTGLLYRGGDPMSLAEAIRQVLLDPVLSVALGQAGKKAAAERFSVDQCIDGVLAVYDTLLRRRI